MEKVEEDRISELPDCLIVEILSRLPSTKEAIRTGTLSRRWKCLWTWVHTLIFTPMRQRLYDPNTMSEFFSYVGKSLTQCRQLKLKKFKVDTVVSTDYYILFESQFKNWIRYAIRCNVEELNLGIWNEELKAEQLLDEMFFVSSCFTNLKLKCVNFNPIRGISWKKLRSLSMVDVKLDELVIENILCVSPLLETLKLRYCYGYRQLNITSKSVKNLHLYGYGGPDDEIEGDMKINAPHILSLTMEDNMFLWMVSLLNVSALIEANLNYLELGDWGMTCEYEEKTLKDFIVNLLHVKDLKIGVACAKILSRLEAKGFKVPSNIKFLDVTNDLYNDLVESEEDL